MLKLPTNMDELHAELTKSDRGTRIYQNGQSSWAACSWQELPRKIHPGSRCYTNDATVHEIHFDDHDSPDSTTHATRHDQRRPFLA